MSASTVQTISGDELSQKLAPPNKTDSFVLLDVRTPDEWQFCRIEGARHIPMSEIEQRAGELDASRDIIVYCHRGVRSRKVAEYLLKRGFPRVASLAGGIDAWSQQIDPSVPRYS